MTIKKRNIVSVNLTERAVLVLQYQGYMDKAKNLKGKRFSKYISRLIISDFGLISPSDVNVISQIAIKNRIREVSEKRDELETELKRLHDELVGIQATRPEILNSQPLRGKEAE